LADEVCGTLAHLIAYVGALVLLAILGIHLLDQLPVGAAIEPSIRAAWSVATRSHPAFAVSQVDLPEKTETYAILRYPLGGWSCQGDALPARRAAIGCILNRLVLLTAGNEPKLAELFARAEFKRGGSAPSAASATSTEWVMGAENPHLHGTL
jgi:hypothetical protein